MKYEFNPRISHFVLPKQWESMRVARELERKTGAKIVHFEKGDYGGSDFETPPHILEAAERALRDGYVRYDPGPGLQELREAIARDVIARGRPTQPEEVIVTAGAKHALMMSLLTFLSDGDEVIFPNPGYPPDEVWAKFARVGIKHLPLKLPNWEVDVDTLDSMITPKTRLLILNSPQRPSGQLISNVEEIAKVVLKHPNLMVITDEIFSHVVYDGHKHKTIAAVPGMEDRTILIDTFSKTYGMTGWRIGWAVAPKAVTEKLSIFLQDSITNVAAFIQRAAYAAMTGPHDWVDAKLATLQRKRDRMVAGLQKIPDITCAVPKGAFYVFPDIRGTGLTSAEFANSLIEQAGVAVVAGTAFGDRGEGFVRLTYAVEDADIDNGVTRIAEHVANLRAARTRK